MGRRISPRDETDLEELIARIALVNPTGRGLRRSEERARYLEKARLQSLLIEHHADEVRVRVHDDMPGIVSLSVPRLQASAAHASLDALSARARAFIETQLLASVAHETQARDHDHGQDKPSAEPSLIARAEGYLAEFDFDCAIQTLTDAAADITVDKEERARALLLLLEIHVDHLANDQAALALEPALRALGSVAERAHELLGIAASRAGEVARALHHLGKCRGERVGEALAKIARESMHERAWGAACKAWAQLNALAAMTEPPLSTSIFAQCSEVRRLFEQQASIAKPDKIQVDDDLERFVREFAPQHPWLEQRRHHEQAARMRSSLRNTLQKARQARMTGDYEGVLQLLGSIAPMLPDADKSEVEDLVAWAEEHRAITYARRALALAHSDDLDGACHAYVALSDDARKLVRERGSTPLFDAIDALNEAFVDRCNSRPILRAAMTWATARHLDPHAQWHVIAPHAALLERVPAFAANIHHLRQTCTQTNEPTDLIEHETKSKTREISLKGIRFRMADEATAPTLRTVDIASQTLRIGAEPFVLTLDELSEDACWALSLWPCRRTGKPKRIHIEGMKDSRPRRVFAAQSFAGIVDDQGTLWLVHFEPDLCVWHVKPNLTRDVLRDAEIVVVDDEHLAFGSPDAAGSPWQVVDLHTGATRVELQQRIFWARRGAGAQGYRNVGLCVERVDHAGRVHDHFELPKSVTPRAIMESPFSPRPVVLAAATMYAAAMVFWQPEPRFFRAIEVFNEADHGVYLDGLTLPGRGIFILTRRPSGIVFLHELVAEQGVLRPIHRRLEVPHFVALVGDPSGRRAWLLTRSKSRGIEIRTLSISDAEE